MQLQDVCELDRRTVPASEAISRGLGFVGMEHVDPVTGAISSGAGSRTGEGKGQAFLFDERHVLFGKLRPYLKKIALPEQAGCSSTELVPLLPDTERLDRKYLFYWVRRQSVIDALMEKNTGARMPRADMKVLLGFDVNLPSLNEQQRITALLDQAAEIKRRTDEAREKAGSMISALFLDMFGDPASNPNDWPMKPLGELIASITGGKNIAAGGGKSRYRILKVSAVTSGTFRPTEAKPAPDFHDPSTEHYIRKDDFLFSRANTGALVGAVAIVDEDYDDLLLPDKLWRIEWHDADIQPRYAYSLLRSEEVRRIFARVASGTSDSMKNISQAKLKQIEVPVAPTHLQLDFSHKVADIEAVTSALDSASRKAGRLTEALSASVFG